MNLDEKVGNGNEGRDGHAKKYFETHKSDSTRGGFPPEPPRFRVRNQLPAATRVYFPAPAHLLLIPQGIVGVGAGFVVCGVYMKVG